MDKVLQAKQEVDPSLSKPENVNWQETAQIENQYQDPSQGQGSPVQDFDKSSSSSSFDTTSTPDFMDEPDQKRIHYEKEHKEDQNDKKMEDEENLNLEDLVLARKMFGNHLILSKILEHLPSKELLQCRLINKMFEEESTRLAVRRRSIYIHFRFDVESKIHFVPYKTPTIPNDHNYTNNNNYTLNKLNECIEASRCFPFGHFYFNGGDLSSKSIQDFLDLHGNEIRILDLNLKLTLSSLKNVLTNQAPRIQQLLLKRIPEEWKNDDESPFFPQQIVLSHLKYLYFNLNCSIVQEIINASPNLQKIDGDLVQLLDNPIILKRSHLIKNLVLNVDPMTINLEHFAKKKPQLEQLTLASLSKTLMPLQKHSLYNQSRFSNALTIILESSSSSLKMMEISLTSEYFVGIEWPKLEKVEYLIVRQSRSSQSFPLAPNFFPAVVPNLVSLSLHFSRQGPTTVLSSLLSLKRETKLVHLKRVSLKYALPEILQKLLIIAPNLEELSARFIPSLSSIKNYIWGFKNLKKLELGILVAPLMLNNLFPHIDYAITGLSEKMICDLQDPSYFEEMKGKDISREGRTILDCKDLQLLKIRLVAARMHIIGIFVPSPNRKMSWAMGEFGFKKLPDLKVDISVDADTQFDVNQLSPYANITSRSPQ